MRKSLLAIAAAATIGIGTVMAPTPASALSPLCFLAIWLKVQSMDAQKARQATAGPVKVATRKKSRR